jgi:hypothetical protein
MKNLIILIFAMLTFAACKKSNNQPLSIAGKWYLSSDSTTYYTSNNVSGQYTYTTSPDTYYITFNADSTGEGYNTALSNPPAGLFSFTYSVNGSAIIIHYAAQTLNGTVYYATDERASIQTLTGNHLTLIFTPVITGGLAGFSEKETQYFGK